MNQIGFEEITVEIHPVEVDTYCKTHDGNCNTRTVSVDTLDLSSCSFWKNGFIVGKTIAVDTSDLEAHYEFYKTEQQRKFTKTVATDTNDLECRIKPRTTSNIGVDTCDLHYHTSGNCCLCVPLVRDCPVLFVHEDSSKKHYLDTSQVKNHDKENGENLEIRKDFERTEEAIFIKSDIDGNVEQNINEGHSSGNNQRTALFLSSNIIMKTDTKDLKERRPFHYKKDVQTTTSSCTNKLEITRTSNSRRNNESEGSDFESGEVEESVSHMNETIHEVTAGDKPLSFEGDIKENNVKEISCDSASINSWEKGLKVENELNGEDSSTAMETKFECDICKAIFPQKYKLVVHLQFHNGFTPFCCEDCGKAFSSLDQLRSHVHVHTVKCHFKCDVCDISLSSEQDLKYHTLTHSGKRPNECCKCKKEFMSEKEFQAHLCEQGSEKQLENCDLCEKKFRSGTALYNHIRATHKTENVQATLAHVKTPFECLTCGKVFRCRSALRCHETVHTGERNFVCETCNKAFPTKASLKAHSSTHTGLKPFVCTTCDNGQWNCKSRE